MTDYRDIRESESMVASVLERFERLYPFQFEMEKKFNTETNIHWIQSNWKLSIYYSIIYVVFIGSGRYYMRNRPRFELRPLLALWSGCLAIFSILGFVRLLPEFVDGIMTYGFRYSVCSRTYIMYRPTSFWSYIFAISKVYELGDTVFIVLRKQPLIFLHWYHHIATLMYCWFSYTELIGPARWFMFMNFAVHSIMYSYYTLKALQFKVPRFISMLITALQLSQMAVALTVNIYTYNDVIKSSGKSDCYQTYSNFMVSLVMYISYLALFANFFYQSYFKRKPAETAVQNGKPLTNGNIKQD